MRPRAQSRSSSTTPSVLAHDKSVMLEDAGGPPSPDRLHTAVEKPRQQVELFEKGASRCVHHSRALNSSAVWYDSSSTGVSDHDVYTIWHNSAEYTPDVGEGACCGNAGKGKAPVASRMVCTYTGLKHCTRR